MKRFLEWIRVKISLDYSKAKPPLVSEGDIWWASLGENVGHEINGKGESFSRAIIIFRKISYGSYLVIPTTSQPHRGAQYVMYWEYGKKINACLHQIRVIDYRRLREKVGSLRKPDMARIEKEFRNYYRL
jgi:mRNA interferase MazF